MLKLRTEKLTSLEKRIHNTLSETAASDNALKIVEAAELCEVSPSKVSKLVRKLGFENFKQYKLYFSGDESAVKMKQKSNEIERLMQFLEHYDDKIVDDFMAVFTQFDKVIIYGLGPSYICGEYFAYKLGTLTKKNIYVTQNEEYAGRLADENTLLIVLSVTGTFSSFRNLFTSMRDKGAQIMLILEEHINTRDFDADYIFRLTKFAQDENLMAFEKTRTLFFIFIEEIIFKLRQELNET
ncbi:MurR/RpiR family transcriptional regulator [Halobacillus kuroshimensis]|uniref:MurR/RpiR family transcriptional regulator n=1 Tax=Halobacillus kuroshimensis TaxID=302481 RepID=UPI00041F8A39|nr:SIS domain-containing protein [Halobacillus kuroshimensis]